MTMNRRNVLVGGVAAAAALGGLAVAYVTGFEEEIVEALVRRRLGQLTFRDEDLAAFCSSYVEHRSGYRAELRLLSTVDPLFRVVTPYDLLPMGSAWRRLEDNVVSSFLLATDFFEHRADTHRMLTYIGFHDPYERPCRRLFVD